MQSVLESRRQQIEMMSQSELNRLKRNYEAYLKLSPERREQLALLQRRAGAGRQERRTSAKTAGPVQRLVRQAFAVRPGEAAEHGRPRGTCPTGAKAAPRAETARGPCRKRVLPPVCCHPFRRRRPTELERIGCRRGCRASRTSSRTRRRNAGRRRSRPETGISKFSDSRWSNCGASARRGTEMRPREMRLVNTMLDAIPNETIKSQITRGRYAAANPPAIGPDRRPLRPGRMEAGA